MRFPIYAAITVVLALVLMLLVALFSVVGRNFEMQLLREGYMSANRLPQDAQLGDFFFVKDSKYELVQPRLVCNNYNDPLQTSREDLEELIESRTRSRYLDNSGILQGAVEYLDKNPSEIVAAMTFFRNDVLKVGEYVTAISDLNPNCEESFKPGCYLAYVSDVYVLEERIAFTTSKRCQLFRYEEMSNEEIDKLISDIDIYKLFHVPFPYRVSLKLSNILKL